MCVGVCVCVCVCMCVYMCMYIYKYMLFYRYKFLKFVDFVSIENGIFVNKCFNDNAFSSFSNRFKLTASSHSYNS